MRKAVVALAGWLSWGAWLPGATAAPLPDQAAQETPTDVRASVDRAIEKVYPALVRLQVVTVDYAEGREVKGESAGSGVIIAPEGFLITNHHVAGNAKRIRCTLADRREVEATLIGSDALADIAVAQLDLGSDPGPPAARFGDSDRLRVGDTVLAMGSPLALSQSVTLGIVSNTKMTMPALPGMPNLEQDGEETGSIVRWIGHDASIFPGNSGGPLVNLEGEIVGINEISLGLGGAIPGNLARAVAEEIIRNHKVRRSFLGLTVQPRLMSQDLGRGALIASVLPGSPAAEAGVKPGDILLRYDGQPVSVRYPEELPELNRRMLATPVGAKVEIVVARDGKEQSMRAVTIERGLAESGEAEVKSWGMSVRDITLLASYKLHREPGSGIVVSGVRPGAPAGEAKPPLQRDDVIVEVARVSVRQVRDFLDRVVGFDGQAVTPVLVGFERRGQKLLTVVKPGLRRSPDRSPEATRAWLPAATQVLTADLAEALGLKGKTGVRVTQVHGNGTPAASGLRVGDILLDLDGQPIAASRPEDVEVLSALVRQYPVGAVVTLSGVREGQPLRLEVHLAPSPISTRELVEYRNLEFDFNARDLTFQDRLQNELDRDQTGALVTGVEAGGWAALARMAVGDIVLSVDGRPMANVAALEAYMKEVTTRRPPRVVFFVRRGVQTHFLEIEPAWPS